MNREYDVKNVLRGQPMKEYIKERAVAIANYIVDYNATVRQTAKKFGISKSTVHKDMTERLLEFNPVLHNEVRKILDLNTDERAARGGRATQLMHKRKRVTSNKNYSS
jgi:putative DeoR family transcriptional regulator (stage III sporulation protein D)